MESVDTNDALSRRFNWASSAPNDEMAGSVAHVLDKLLAGVSGTQTMPILSALAIITLYYKSDMLISKHSISKLLGPLGAFLDNWTYGLDPSIEGGSQALDDDYFAAIRNYIWSIRDGWGATDSRTGEQSCESRDHVHPGSNAVAHNTQDADSLAEREKALMRAIIENLEAEDRKRSIDVSRERIGWQRELQAAKNDVKNLKRKVTGLKVARDNMAKALKEERRKKHQEALGELEAVKKGFDEKQEECKELQKQLRNTSATITDLVSKQAEETTHSTRLIKDGRARIGLLRTALAHVRIAHQQLAESSASEKTLLQEELSRLRAEKSTHLESMAEAELVRASLQEERDLLRDELSSVKSGNAARAEALYELQSRIGRLECDRNEFLYTVKRSRMGPDIYGSDDGDGPVALDGTVTHELGENGATEGFGSTTDGCGTFSSPVLLADPNFASASAAPVVNLVNGASSIAEPRASLVIVRLSAPRGLGLTFPNRPWSVMVEEDEETEGSDTMNGANGVYSIETPARESDYRFSPTTVQHFSITTHTSPIVRFGRRFAPEVCSLPSETIDASTFSICDTAADRLPKPICNNVEDSAVKDDLEDSGTLLNLSCDFEDVKRLFSVSVSVPDFKTVDGYSDRICRRLRSVDRLRKRSSEAC